MPPPLPPPSSLKFAVCLSCLDMIEALVGAGFSEQELKRLWLIYDDMCHWWRYGGALCVCRLARA